MKRIALIGESPNDTKAIKHLLERRYKDKYLYFPLLDHIKGSQLDSPKAIKAYCIACKQEKPDYIIVIRDSDGFAEDDRTQKRRQWFENLCKENALGCHVFLLNIHAIEALLLADIDTVNHHYGTSIKYTGDVTRQEKPDKFLERKTDEAYDKNHCPVLFSKLDIETLIKKCRYFKNFIIDFEKAINN